MTNWFGQDFVYDTVCVNRSDIIDLSWQICEFRHHHTPTCKFTIVYFILLACPYFQESVLVHVGEKKVFVLKRRRDTQTVPHLKPH